MDFDPKIGNEGKGVPPAPAERNRLPGVPGTKKIENVGKSRIGSFPSTAEGALMPKDNSMNLETLILVLGDTLRERNIDTGEQEAAFRRLLGPESDASVKKVIVLELLAVLDEPDPENVLRAYLSKIRFDHPGIGSGKNGGIRLDEVVKITDDFNKNRTFVAGKWRAELQLVLQTFRKGKNW